MVNACIYCLSAKLKRKKQIPELKSQQITMRNKTYKKVDKAI